MCIVFSSETSAECNVDAFESEDDVLEVDAAESLDVCLEAMYGCVDFDDGLRGEVFEVMRMLIDGCVRDVRTI